METADQITQQMLSRLSVCLQNQEKKTAHRIKRNNDKQCPDSSCSYGCPIYQKQHIELLANKKNKLQNTIKYL